jgi:protease IV
MTYSGIPSQTNPPVIHVRAKPGGFLSALAFIIALMIFAAVFVGGIVIGAVGASAARPTLVFEQVWRDGGRNRVAIIPVEGVILDPAAEFVRSAVDHVLKDARYRAVVLRVDSPGGAVAASDQIWHQVERLKKAGLPVVASYGGVAASGGYYVSCGADHIVAEETCITGSIGVIAQVFTMQGLMDKIGVEPVTIVASGSPRKSVANDIFRQWDERDQETVLTMLDAAYAIFNERVRTGRGGVITDPADIDRLADGSIYTASQAMEGGLVDSIGYLDDAIAQAESLAGLVRGRAKVLRIRKPPTLMGALTGAEAAGALSAPLLDASALREAFGDLARPRVMYLMW